jgi:hypothetical protein
MNVKVRKAMNTEISFECTYNQEKRKDWYNHNLITKRAGIVMYKLVLGPLLPAVSPCPGHAEDLRVFLIALLAQAFMSCSAASSC